jgi:hypothetical protein
MSNVTFLDVVDPFTEEVIIHAIIEHEDGCFTSMTKAHYETLQAANEAQAL